MNFTWPDWLVLIAFFGVILWIGISTKLKESSMLQYLAAGRSLSLPLFVMSLVSAWYGGILGVGESVADYGVGTWLLVGLPYYVFGVIYAVYYSRKVREASQLSIPERLHATYGKNAGLIGGVIIFLLAIPAAHVFMLGVLLQSLTGWPIGLSITLGAAFGALFLFRGGLLADARMGVLAFLLMYVGFAALDIYCLLYRSPQTLIPQLKAMGLTHFDGAQGPLAVVSFFILGAWTLVDPTFHQRVTSSAAPGVARKGVLISVVCWMVFDILSITAGLFAVVSLHPLPKDLAAVFPLFAAQSLPAGLRGLFFIGMTGAVLSAMVGYTLVSGATLSREIYARIRTDLTDAEVARITRVGLAIACVCAIFVAKSVESVVDLWYSWAGALVGSLLIPVTLSYLPNRRWKPSLWGVCISLALSAGVAITIMVIGLRTDNPFLMVSTLGQQFSLGTLAPAVLISVLVLGIDLFWSRLKSSG